MKLSEIPEERVSPRGSPQQHGRLLEEEKAALRKQWEDQASAERKLVLSFLSSVSPAGTIRVDAMDLAHLISENAHLLRHVTDLQDRCGKLLQELRKEKSP